ncbi:hypothetical protein [Streptomyces sp. CB01881]|uniref:hypothetical protein n=1 Tax=Streptomyces sp. CB01881 TaxID=2078691 RepID=UPI000CDC2FB2|nr:hypothetical protein [Streptomyces sp. CB01881]AUY48339.1 hypothetical protein C2142_04490 [Streptomyces sp. CB01881]TYC76825.1 hypothetical protein EH183_04500 [Streptomyces sp. CB01881]
MDIVYASLKRRHPGTGAEASEAAEAVDALWAHAKPADGLQHASAQPALDRIDLLLYLLSRDPSDLPDAVGRAHSLVSRSHRTSPLLRRCYLPPEPPGATGHTAR